MTSEYVIVGSGLSATAAMRVIAHKHYGASITVISSNKQKSFVDVGIPQYLIDDVSLTDLQKLPDDFYVQNNISFIHATVESVDWKKKVLQLSNGQEVSYKKLLLALGAQGIHKYSGADKPQVLSLRTAAEAKLAKLYLGSAQKIVVVGASLQGLQIASTLAKHGYKVVLIERQNRILPFDVPAELASMLQLLMRGLGIQIILHDSVKHFGGQGDQLSYVETQKNVRLETQLAIIAEHKTNDLSLFAKSGIKKRKGLIVDTTMKTSFDNVWASGRIAEVLQGAMRQSIELDDYVDMYKSGLVAGENMSGGRIRHTTRFEQKSLQIADHTIHAMGDYMGKTKGCEVLQEVDRYGHIFVQYVIYKGSLIGACWMNVELDPFVMARIIEREKKITLPKNILNFRPSLFSLL